MNVGADPPDFHTAATDLDATDFTTGSDSRLGQLPKLPAHRPFPHRRKQIQHAAAAVIMLLTGWLVSCSHHGQPAPATEPATTTAASPSSSAAAPANDAAQAAQGAQARLMTLLPPGYPPNTCKPVPALAGAVAEVACGRNIDAGGPLSATYRMFPNVGALGLNFETVVSSSDVVTCPGRIQSPGPWHRTATPEKPTGTLLCAIRQDRPTVAWTNDEALLFGVVQAGPDGPPLEKLFTWWGSHS